LCALGQIKGGEKMTIETDRRTMIAGAATTALLTASRTTAAAPARRAFPKGFRWGVSTAGHQIEGNNLNSDLWFMENINPTTFKDRSGDACDSYHRFEEDIALLAKMGLNTYRFSIEWARIEPNKGQWSNAELDHYKRVIATCRKYGVDPVVTFFHVSAPRWFAESGGWLNPESPDLFARYCAKAAKVLGDGMGHACTINEPQVSLTYRTIPESGAVLYFKSMDEKEFASHAAATKLTGVERFVTMNHPAIKEMTPQLIAAHEKGFAAIKAEQPKLPTGVTLNLVDFQPANEGSKYAELRQIAYGLWLDVAKRSGDFVGVQTYRQIRIPGAGAELLAPAPMPFTKADDRQELIKQPSALRNMVEYVHQMTGKPIFVTENGIETPNDVRRQWYIPQALAGLHEAIVKGVPVIGYCHWSLLDNFEWLQGYKPKFGLVSVDRETFKRTPKPSAWHYGAIAKRNAV
jgi:beta-glucosidase